MHLFLWALHEIGSQSVFDPVSEWSGVQEGFGGSFSPFLVRTGKVRCREAASPRAEMGPKPDRRPLPQALSCSPHSACRTSCGFRQLTCLLWVLISPSTKRINWSDKPSKVYPVGFWVSECWEHEGRMDERACAEGRLLSSPRNSGLGSQDFFLYWNDWPLSPAWVCVFSCWDHWNHCRRGVIATVPCHGLPFVHKLLFSSQRMSLELRPQWWMWSPWTTENTAEGWSWTSGGMQQCERGSPDWAEVWK